MFVDTHCHLNFQAFENDLGEVIKRAHQNKIEKIIIPGAKIDSSQKSINISRNFPHCFSAIGIHPHHVDDFDQSSQDLRSILSSLLLNEKVVAVGEIGLDYYLYKTRPPLSDTDIKKQKELLELQLDLAITSKLPVIIHCREAQNDLLELIKNYSSQHTLKGVFHCFDGTSQYLAKVIDLGFYIGFDGNITFNANTHLRELVSKTPLDRLLLETDSPYLTPIPHRGERNEPSFLVYTAQCVAEVTQKPLDEIEFTTEKNAHLLFQI